jgi:hypothetical protein
MEWVDPTAEQEVVIKGASMVCACMCTYIYKPLPGIIL